MIEHGISTSKAHYWVHLFPLKGKAFWYRVTHCRAYIAFNNPPIMIGKSKDGTPTGAGYLVPQASYFILEADVARRYLSHVPDWLSLTDRESGLRGQEIVYALIEHGLIRFPVGMVVACTERKLQNDGIDGMVKWRVKPLFEVKTERVNTPNLFVQIRESGHRTNLTQAGEKRDSEFQFFPEQQE